MPYLLEGYKCIHIKKKKLHKDMVLVLILLVYQLVLPRGLIRVILEINNTTNNYNYLSHALSSIEYSNTNYKIYIYHNIVAKDFILHITPCVFDIYKTIYL